MSNKNLKKSYIYFLFYLAFALVVVIIKFENTTEDTVMNAKKIRMIEKEIKEFVDTINASDNFERDRKELALIATPIFDNSKVPLLTLARFATKRVYVRYLFSSLNVDQNPWASMPSKTTLKSCLSRVAQHLTEDLDETKHRAYLMLKYFLHAQLKHEKNYKENLINCLLYAILVLREDFVKEYTIAMECQRWK
jgi:hypothetical protein